MGSDGITTPCIVAGRDITGLGALRSLAAAGIPVYTACDDPLIPRSRYYRPATTRSGRRWKLELGQAGHELLADLPFARAVMIPCADDITAWLASLPPELKARFPSCHAPLESLARLQDKRDFSALCQRLAVPHPRCIQLECEEDIESIPFGELERVFLKPSNSIQFLAQFHTKGFWVRNRQEACERFRQVQQVGLSVLAQEYVSGGVDDHYFIDGFRDQQGVVRARLARRRVRIYPLDFGNSSYCYQIPLEEIQPAWASLDKLLSSVDYRGIFSAEFKRDAHDGLFKILEVNTRVWVYVGFAFWCGVNVCHMAYRDALDMPVETVTPRRLGGGCLNAYLDYCSLRSIPRSQRPPIATIAHQWWRSHKSVYSLRDPLPAAGWFVEMVMEQFRPSRGQRSGA